MCTRSICIAVRLVFVSITQSITHTHNVKTTTPLAANSHISHTGLDVKMEVTQYAGCVSANVHGKYVYSTLALGKEREIVKEETALRKEKEAVYCYVHVDVHV